MPRVRDAPDALQPELLPGRQRARAAELGVSGVHGRPHVARAAAASERHLPRKHVSKCSVVGERAAFAAGRGQRRGGRSAIQHGGRGEGGAVERPRRVDAGHVPALPRPRHRHDIDGVVFPHALGGGSIRVAVQVGRCRGGIGGAGARERRASVIVRHGFARPDRRFGHWRRRMWRRPLDGHTG